MDSLNKEEKKKYWKSEKPELAKQWKLTYFVFALVALGVLIALMALCIADPRLHLVRNFTTVTVTVVVIFYVISILIAVSVRKGTNFKVFATIMLVMTPILSAVTFLFWITYMWSF